MQDIELINMTRFFASLRMTNFQLWEFSNNLIGHVPEILGKMIDLFLSPLRGEGQGGVIR